MGAGLLPSTQGESDHSRAAQERISVTSSRSSIIPATPTPVLDTNVFAPAYFMGPYPAYAAISEARQVAFLQNATASTPSSDIVRCEQC